MPDSEPVSARLVRWFPRSPGGLLLLLPMLPACAPDPPPADAAWLSLEGLTGTPTGRLIGWNLGRGTLYSPEDGPTHPEWRTPERAAAVQGLAGIRAPDQRPYIRFSGLQIDGSAGGDGYHFEDFVRLDRTVSDDDNMAVYEYMAIVEEADAEPVVTVNFGSGTAAEAAAYARYLNSEDGDDPLVQARTTWGRDQPYDVRIFELGNETFAWWNTGWSDTYAHGYANPDAVNGGDPDWFGRPSADAADFGARALAYVDAIAAVSPEARFWVPLSMANMQAWGGTTAAVDALRPLLEHDAVQAAVVHHYQVDDAFSLGVEGLDDPQLIISGSALYTPLFAQLRAELATLDRTEPLALSLSEFHVAGFFAGSRFPYQDQAIVGLGIADMLIAYADWGIEHAAQHLALDFDGSDELLFEAWYNPYRADGSGGVVAMPTAQVTQLFADAVRARTLAPVVLQQPELDRQGDYRYPAVHAVVFAEADGSALSLVALNRDLDQPRLLRVELDGRWELASAQAWAPERWDQDALADPVEVTPLDVDLSRRHLDLELPPHSVASVRLSSR